MFKNLINIHDFQRLAEKIRQGDLRSVLLKIFSGNQKRVQSTWEHDRADPKHWWDIPAVIARRNRMVTGSPSLDPQSYFARKYFTGEPKKVALSIGCGTGTHEGLWAQQGVFRRIDAFDLSAPRIEFARARAKNLGLDKVLHFSVADAFQYPLLSGGYDVIIAEGALHHLSPLSEMVGRIHQGLKPGGYLVINEFVGPNRFQWTDEQLEAVNRLLQDLPESRRRRFGTASVKKRFYRPGRLAMYVNDPSEAAESAAILPLIRERFEEVEVRPYGGTVLQLLFDGIAHNFLAEDEDTNRLLDGVFLAEDHLIKAGKLPSDFVFGLYRKKIQEPGGHPTID